MRKLHGTSASLSFGAKHETWVIFRLYTKDKAGIVDMPRKRRIGARVCSTGRSPVAIRTRPDGRKYPITPRTSRSGPSPDNWDFFVLDSTLAQRAGKSVLGKVIHALALTNPFVAQIYGAYNLAKAVFENLDSLKEIGDAFRQQGLLGAAWTAGEGKLSDYLSSEQESLLLSIIPARYRALGRHLLSSGVSMLTDSEMKFLDRHF